MGCTRTVFLFLNAFMLLVGFGTFIFGIIVSGNQGVLGDSILPVSWYLVVLGLGLALAFISSIGIFSVRKRSRVGTCCYLFFTMLLMIAVATIGVSLILYANDEAGALEGPVQGVQDDLELFMIKYGQENTESWKNIQNSLDCCGVNFASTYIVNPSLLTGDKCNDATAILEISSIQTLFPTFTAEAQAIAENSTTIGNESGGFFCADNVVETMRRRTVEISVVVSVLVAIFFFEIVLVFALFCGVREEDGGFAVLDEDAYEPSQARKGYVNAGGAPRNDSDLPEANAGIGGNTFLKPAGAIVKAEQFANRMSMRMGFTPHTPRYPGAYSSTDDNNSTTVAPAGRLTGYSGLADDNGGGMGRPAPPPRPMMMGFNVPSSPSAARFGGAVKDFGNRMSLNLKTAFSGRPPPPPPAGFGGGLGGPSSSGFGGPPPPPPSMGGMGGGFSPPRQEINFGGGPQIPLNVGSSFGSNAPPRPPAPAFPNIGNGSNRNLGMGGMPPPPPASSMGASMRNMLQAPPPSMMSSPPPPPPNNNTLPRATPATIRPASGPKPAAPSGGGGGGNSKVKSDPKYKKYVTMEKCNLPEGAIRQKMTLDGMSEADQDKFFA